MAFFRGILKLCVTLLTFYRATWQEWEFAFVRGILLGFHLLILLARSPWQHITRDGYPGHRSPVPPTSGARQRGGFAERTEKFRYVQTGTTAWRTDSIPWPWCALVGPPTISAIPATALFCIPLPNRHNMGYERYTTSRRVVIIKGATSCWSTLIATPYDPAELATPAGHS